MAEYRSSHSGTEIDEAVTKVLNGTAGLQGFKFMGTEITPDVNNKVNLDWSHFVTEGTWTPYAGAISGTDPVCDYSDGYRNGYYYKIGKLCFIFFELRFKVVSASPYSYLCIKGIPFEAEGRRYAFSAGEISDDGQIPYPNVDEYGGRTRTFRIGDNGAGIHHIDVLHHNGKGHYPLVAASGDQLTWLNGSGFYVTTS